MDKQDKVYKVSRPESRGGEGVNQTPNPNPPKTPSSTLQHQRSSRKRSSNMRSIHKPIDLTKIESKIRDKIQQDKQHHQKSFKTNNESLGEFYIRPEGLANKIEQSYDSVDQSNDYMRIRDILHQNSVIDVAEQILSSDILNRLMQTPTLNSKVAKTGPAFYHKKTKPFLSQEHHHLKLIENQLYSNKQSFNEIIRIRNELSPRMGSQAQWTEAGNVFADDESCRVVPKYDRQSKMSSKISYGFARQQG